MAYFSRFAVIAVVGASLLPVAVMADGPSKWSKSEAPAKVTFVNARMDELPSVRNERLWQKGERISRNHVRIRQPGQFGLDPNATYWRSYDYIYRVNNETGEVLAQVGSADRVIGQ
ncbi:hypothetical protein [Thioclava atlantica]|uniref:Uncharacterized protein n=1 Tax=Thioclava atlantica TaxID=1317124 RepID=A0A085TW91_9RHOB|nr:hypothetical protein [Thioclava atlantica]KFE34988.1 hypothetical protein DW2_10504 [Thioclava atlantica]